MIRAPKGDDASDDVATPRAKSPIASGRGKMSPQAAVGFGRWPDEKADGGRQSKHRGVDNGKRKTIRTLHAGYVLHQSSSPTQEQPR